MVDERQEMNKAIRQELMGTMRQEFIGEIQNLRAENRDMSATQQRHSTTLHSLHCRVVLDDARELISMRYNFTISELRLGGQGVAGKPKKLSQLVCDVRSRLSKDDALLLNDDALSMIFDGSLGTVRSGGNAVAHSASKEDLSIAIHGPGLTVSQTATLQNIYAFAYYTILQL